MIIYHQILSFSNYRYFQVKRVTGGQIRKTLQVKSDELLGLPEWENYLECPTKEYLLTCEYYWVNVS
jgi:hypothetical protein